MKRRKLRRPSSGPCPCGTGPPYTRCCQPFHKGAPAPDVERLMRSRYAAYALAKTRYIMATTHPEGPHFRADEKAWHEELLAYCKAVSFLGLEVQDVESVSESEGRVTFHARVEQDGKDLSFTETSTFLREGERWLYHSGEMRE